MIVMQFRMTTGRYHATPWYHHVNEGAVEWPPSPWRILRALIATWHRKAQGEVEEAVLRDLIDKLSSELPAYSLPQAVASHTRHYMPPYKGNTTKVFDAFLHLELDQPIEAQWRDLILDEHERGVLSLLLSRLSYLGRAESWTAARLLDHGAEPNVLPDVTGAPIDTGHELVRVLAPVPTSDFERWHASAVDELVTRKLADKRRKKPDKEPKITGAERKKIDAALCKDLFAALHAETTDLRKQGWSRAPGSRWCDYRMPHGLVSVLPTRQRARPVRSNPSVARFAVASQAPPRLTEAIIVSDRVRKILLKRTNGHAVFSARDSAGDVLTGHRHAFILPESNGQHGHITHVTIAASMAFDEDCQRVLHQLDWAWGRRGHDLQLVLVGLGEAGDFAGNAWRQGACPLLSTARTWVSRTPFVPTRHAKRRRNGTPRRDDRGLWIGSPEHDLRRLLAEGGFPEPVSVASVKETLLGGKRTRWMQFRTIRPKGSGRRGANHGYGFCVEFPEPVTGPIAVGYGAHFGLGAFVPVGTYDSA